MSPNPHSTASIAGHPLHPMVIPFPVAFFAATLAADIAYAATSNPAWATATVWLLGAGLVMAALAAILGLIDFFGDTRIRALNDAWLHAGFNVVLVLIEIYNWYSRYRYGAPAIIPTGLVLSVIAVLIMLFTGWKGWEMVYRHRVGIADKA